jgi:hypothetical protein
MYRVRLFFFQGRFDAEDEDYKAVVLEAPAENTVRGEYVRDLLQEPREERRTGEKETPPLRGYHHQSAATMGADRRL